MAAQNTVAELLKRNKEIIKTYQPFPLLMELPSTAMPKIFIVTCCDNRIDMAKILGLETWEAIVVRSAAGRVTPQLQNLLFLDQFLQSSFTDIMIVHHTDCSASMLQNHEVRQALKERAPQQEEEIDRLALPGFDNLEQSVRDDVQIVKSSPLFRKELRDQTTGFVLNIQTGRLSQVI